MFTLVSKLRASVEITRFNGIFNYFHRFNIGIIYKFYLPTAGSASETNSYGTGSGKKVRPDPDPQHWMNWVFWELRLSLILVRCLS